MDGITFEGKSHQPLRQSRTLEAKKALLSHVSLSSGLIIVFLMITTIICGAIIGQNYIKTTQLTYGFLSKSLQEMSRRVLERADRTVNPLIDLAAELAALMALPPDDRATVANPFDQRTRVLLSQAMEYNPQISSVFVAYDDGGFTQLYAIPNGDTLEWSDVQSPPGARFAMRRLSGPAQSMRQERWTFFDENMFQLGAEIIGLDSFDPRERPWFKLGKESDQVVVSKPYAFATLDAVGITVSRKFSGAHTGVVGVDMTLSGLSRALGQLEVSPNGTIAIFDGSGSLIAYPSDTSLLVKAATPQRPATVSELGDPILSALYQQAFPAIEPGVRPSPKARLSSDQTSPRPVTDVVEFRVDGKWFVGQALLLPDKFGIPAFIAIAEPQSEVLSGVDQITKQNLVVSAVLLMVTGVIIVLVSRLLTRPVRALAKETHHIRMLQLGDRQDVHSRFTELQDLSDGMAAMKSTVRAFQRYLPMAVVERLVRGDSDAGELGGENRDVTIMFTDVVGFTDMADMMPPQDLTRKLSSYLNRLNGPIVESHGVVDKFIGDSVLVVWNGYRDLADHEFHACTAALNCRRSNRELNALWRQFGWPEMHTRYGIHTGDAVVGNIGSSDRMDFTTIGASVNTASRLESLNKVYGTDIMVSETVHAKVKDRFLMRSVDWVRPKGVSRPVKVYELIGSLDPDSDLSASKADRRRCAIWEAIYSHYLSRNWAEAADRLRKYLAEYPEDRVAEIYRERAERFAIAPPPEEWDGIEKFNYK